MKLFEEGERQKERRKRERKKMCHIGNRRKSIVVTLSMAIVFRLGSLGNKVGNLQIFTRKTKFLYCRRLSEGTEANATLSVRAIVMNAYRKLFY